LKSSIEALTDVDLTEDGAKGVEAAVGEVKDDLEALGDSVGDELKPEVEGVQDALDGLQSAVESGGMSQALSAVSTLASSAATLVASLENASCG
jgi:hypothetical protein